MSLPFPLRFLVALAAVSSFLFASSGADDVDSYFEIGGTLTLSCPRQPANSEDDLMKWAIGSKTIFENGDLTGGISKGERYKVKMTDEVYDLTVESLTSDDNGAMFLCMLDDGDDTTTIKRYRLKLKGQITTQPPPAVVVTDAAPVVVTDAAPVVPTSKKVVDDSKEPEQKEGKGEEEEVDKKDLSAGGGNGDNGAPRLTSSSALAAVLMTMYALTL